MTNVINPDDRNSPLVQPDGLDEDQRACVNTDNAFLQDRRQLNQMIDLCGDLRNFHMSEYQLNLLKETKEMLIEFKNDQVDRHDAHRIEAGKLGLNVR